MEASKIVALKLSLLSIFIFYKIASFVGLSSFRYDWKQGKFVKSNFLYLYSWIFSMSFVLAYPSSLFVILRIYREPPNGVIEHYKNSMYIWNWLVGSLIYFILPKSVINVYNRALNLHHIFEERHIFKHKISPVVLTYEILRCVLKTFVLSVGFFFIDIIKYGVLIVNTRELEIYEFALLFYLFIPSMIIIFSSNRYFVGMTFVVCSLKKINHRIKFMIIEIKSHKFMKDMEVSYGKNLSEAKLYENVANDIKVLCKIYTELHEICLEFNKIFSNNILLVFGFCVINIVFEVSK